MNKSPEQDISSKEHQRLQRQAHNLARYAVRTVGRGQIDVEIEPKTMPWYVPFVNTTVDPEVYQMANEQLAANGIQVEQVGIPEYREGIPVFIDVEALHFQAHRKVAERVEERTGNERPGLKGREEGIHDDRGGR